MLSKVIFYFFDEQQQFKGDLLIYSFKEDNYKV